LGFLLSRREVVAPKLREIHSPKNNFEGTLVLKFAQEADV